MPEDTDKIEAGGTHIPEAYDAYLGAQQLARDADTNAEIKTALQAVDRAIELDRRYAPAYALRARLLRDATIAESDPIERRRLFDLARQAAERAVAIAPTFAELDPGSATSQDYLSGLEMVLDHRESAISATGA